MILHPGLPPLPEHMKRLRVDDRGFPVPWFVQWLNPDGTSAKLDPGLDARPDFRVMDIRKLSLALRWKLCWVCGQPLGRYLAFVIGPMCAVNRISSEPPSHRDCAEFSARGCPFLSKPQVVRRENDKPPSIVDAAGHGLDRNPGVTLVWITRAFERFMVPGFERGGIVSNEGVLFRIGESLETLWFREGRPATRAEILASIDSGMPELERAAALDGKSAIEELGRRYQEALRLLPAAESAA